MKTMVMSATYRQSSRVDPELLVRDPEVLERTFRVGAPYLTEMAGGIAAYTDGAFKDKGIELTRRFRALKVWMALKEHGVDGFRRERPRQCKGNRTATRQPD